MRPPNSLSRFRRLPIPFATSLGLDSREGELDQRTELLIEFRQRYEKLEAARQSKSYPDIQHAQRNFQAASEALARRVSLFLEGDDAE